MKYERSHNIRLGIFVFAGLILLVFGLYSIGRNKNLFGKSIHISAVFYDVNGLISGNNVRYAGIDVGTVSNIEIINDSAVRVEMIIEEKTGKFIRHNSIASIGTDGLMGNKLINITPGASDEMPIKENDQLLTLRGVNTDEMLRTLDNTNDNIAVITSNLRIITENLNKSRGALYTVLTDTMLTFRIGSTLENLQTLSTNLISVSNEIHVVVKNVSDGNGTVATLVSDTVVANQLKEAIWKINEGSEHFSSASRQIDELMNKVHNGHGTITTLIQDTAMAVQMKSSISNLEKASVTINEELEAMKHSFLLRPFYKHQKK
jgi:phospholipid/cholesterol/gamma-HCH transport system substrate-binding protein